MKRVKAVEDLNIRFVRAQGIVGVGVPTHMFTLSYRAAVSRRTEPVGSPADQAFSFRCAFCRASSVACSYTIWRSYSQLASYGSSPP